MIFERTYAPFVFPDKWGISLGAEQARHNHQFNWWSIKKSSRKVKEPPMLK